MRHSALFRITSTPNTIAPNIQARPMFVCNDSSASNSLSLCTVCAKCMIGMYNPNALNAVDSKIIRTVWLRSVFKSKNPIRLFCRFFSFTLRLCVFKCKMARRCG